MASKYLVSTTMGDSILDPDNQVYVEVSPSKYLRKSVADINIGDKVIFQKPYAKTKLEDVEPYLPRSPRYAFAKEKIHDTNSRGEYIPRFRALLLQGLCNHGVIDDGRLSILTALVDAR